MSRIGIIIPDRGDRPRMTENILKQMNRQTLPPVAVAHVTNQPRSEDNDITVRYRDGYNRLCGLGLDMIACIENDDWYSKDYLSEMFSTFVSMRRPDIFGIDFTYYYHLPTKFYFRYEHEGRASMMNTCLRPDVNLIWPDLSKGPVRFLDMWLWTHTNRARTWSPNKILSISMKGHGDGKTGGTGHNDRMFRYVNPDNGFLEKHLDRDQLTFFSSYFSKHDFTDSPLAGATC